MNNKKTRERTDADVRQRCVICCLSELIRRGRRLGASYDGSKSNAPVSRILVFSRHKATTKILFFAKKSKLYIPF